MYYFQSILPVLVTFDPQVLQAHLHILNEPVFHNDDDDDDDDDK